MGVFPCRGLVAPCQRAPGSIKGSPLRCQTLRLRSFTRCEDSLAGSRVSVQEFESEITLCCKSMKNTDDLFVAGCQRLYQNLERPASSMGDILFRRHTLLQFFQPVEDHLDAQGAGLRRALLGFNHPDDRSVRRHVKASWRIRN